MMHTMPNTMERTAADHATKILDVHAGGSFEITLWEDRTSGYSWTPSYDVEALDLLDDDYRRTVNVDTADFGKRVFTFQAKKAGEYPLVMELRIGWKFTATNRKSYLIRVGSNP